MQGKIIQNFFLNSNAIFIILLSIKKHLSKMIFICLFVITSMLGTAYAESLEISITEGEFKTTSVAVSPFYAMEQDGETVKIISNISEVISNDLLSSGLFSTISRDAFIQTPHEMRFRPRFDDWRLIKAEILITGNVALYGDDKYTIEMFVWDITREKQILAKKYRIPRKSWRRLSHMMSDDIYSRITGERGYFDSRILFVSESKKGNRRVKQIAIMDSDGERVKYITSGKYLVLTPRFSPDGKRIAYMSYKRGVPAIYLHDIKTGKITFLGQFKNMTYAPRFSPDGRKIIFSYADNGKSNIWEMDLVSKKFIKITNNKFIDTSPSYSVDGKSITFTSDRGGSAQVYTMKIGRVAKRISSGDGSYTTPVWSPRGDLIAFTKQTGGKFYIGVMNVDGSGERLLSNSFLDEGPTFSPNGRVVLFFRNDISSSKNKIMSIDITGQNLREIKTPTSASDPAWSNSNKR